MSSIMSDLPLTPNKSQKCKKRTYLKLQSGLNIKVHDTTVKGMMKQHEDAVQIFVVLPRGTDLSVCW